MGGEIIYEETFLVSGMYIVTRYLSDIYAVDKGQIKSEWIYEIVN